MWINCNVIEIQQRWMWFKYFLIPKIEFIGQITHKYNRIVKEINNIWNYVTENKLLSTFIIYSWNLTLVVWNFLKMPCPGVVSWNDLFAQNSCFLVFNIYLMFK